MKSTGTKKCFSKIQDLSKLLMSLEPPSLHFTNCYGVCFHYCRVRHWLEQGAHNQIIFLYRKPLHFGRKQPITKYIYIYIYIFIYLYMYRLMQLGRKTNSLEIEPRKNKNKN